MVSSYLKSIWVYVYGYVRAESLKITYIFVCFYIIAHTKADLVAYIYTNKIHFDYTLDRVHQLCTRYGVGVTKPICSPFRYFHKMSALWKHTLAYECGVHSWQISPQLSCDYTCQNWKWLNESDRYFFKMENFTDGDCNERSFSNPHPSTKQFSSILVWNNSLRIIPRVCAILCFWVVPYRVIL